MRRRRRHRKRLSKCRIADHVDDPQRGNRSFPTPPLLRDLPSTALILRNTATTARVIQFISLKEITVLPSLKCLSALSGLGLGLGCSRSCSYDSHAYLFTCLCLYGYWIKCTMYNVGTMMGSRIMDHWDHRNHWIIMANYYRHVWHLHPSLMNMNVHVLLYTIHALWHAYAYVAVAVGSVAVAPFFFFFFFVSISILRAILRHVFVTATSTIGI